MRLSVAQSPTRSAYNYGSALRLPDQTVRRILQTDLQFHPYKLKMIAQKLYERDWADHIFIIEHIARRKRKL